jgi:hypothetical protein
MSKLTEQQRKVFDIVITSVQIIAVILSVILSIIIIANPNVSSLEVGSGRLKLLPVLTDSMKGSDKDNFNKGDLVVATDLPADLASLNVGQIVTYLGFAGGSENQLVTHRIVGYAMDNLTEDDPAILDATTYSFFDNGTSQFIMVTNTDLIKNADGSFKTAKNGKSYKECLFGYWTNGDYPALDKTDADYVYNLYQESELVSFENLRALYKSHVGGVGSAIGWLQEPTHFLLVIVLPLLVLFIYNLVLFIQMIMQAKVASAKEKLIAEGGVSNGGVVIDEEEIRRRAIAEYLSSQQLNQEQNNQTQTQPSEKTDETNE